MHPCEQVVVQERPQAANVHQSGWRRGVANTDPVPPDLIGPVLVLHDATDVLVVSIDFVFDLLPILTVAVLFCRKCAL